jgi:hypothetical protein
MRLTPMQGEKAGTPHIHAESSGIWRTHPARSQEDPALERIPLSSDFCKWTMLSGIDHDVFGLNQAKMMNVTDSNRLERDIAGEFLHSATFRSSRNRNFAQPISRRRTPAGSGKFRNAPKAVVQLVGKVKIFAPIATDVIAS